MSNLSPSWDDFNKLKEENSQLRLYIKALVRAIPPSLMQDLAPTLPEIPAFTLPLAENKTKIPPRDSSTNGIKNMTIPVINTEDSIDMQLQENDLIEFESENSAVKSSSRNDPPGGSSPNLQKQNVAVDYDSGSSAVKSSSRNDPPGGSSPNLQKQNLAIEIGDREYRIEVLHTTRAFTPKGKEAMSLILSLIDVLKNEEICQLDKQYSHIAILDVYVSLKNISNRQLKKKNPNENYPALPEKHLFQTFSPYKIDTRKVIYFYLTKG
jgi:hypothetical protein